MAIGEPLVREIVRRVLTVAKPQKMILFGSAATGAMTADSDIDLLIVRTKPDDQRKEYVRIRRALRGLAYPFSTWSKSRMRLSLSHCEVIILTPFGVELRCPGDRPDATVEAAREAVELARKVRDGVLNVLPAK